jgi:hypothetical protein
MNDIEWVAESEWSKVKRGSTVRLQRGNSFIQAGCVQADADSILLSYSTPTAGMMSRREYMHDGWSLFVEAPPAVVLPTEPGNYLDKDGTAWRITARFPFREDLHARHAPFTRLEPVPETAKKVLAAVDEAWMRGHHMGNGSASHRVEVVRSLAAKFGVTL